MLKINFLKEDNNENTANFALAVKYAECDMNIQLLFDDLNKIIKKLQKEDISKEEKDFLVSQKKEISSNIEDIEVHMVSLEPAYVKVVENITNAGNSEEVIVRMLRMISSAGNNKLMKYAVQDLADTELYEALENIHFLSKENEYGMTIQSKAVKQSYKNAKIRLETILKQSFSLSFENDYTTKVNAKFNSSDLKMLNECYVTGIRNKFSSKEDGSINFDTTVVNTLVSKKTNKKTGKTTYNMNKLFKVIADLALVKYCK